MRIKNIVGAFLCLFAVSASLVAQEEKGKKGEPDGKSREMMRRPGGEGAPGMPGGMMMNPVMAALDADKDGTLSVSEIANASKSLMTLDKNGDGVLSTDEMRPTQMAGGQRPGEGGGAPNGEYMGRMFDTWDKNSDGKISADESSALPERMRENIGKIDEDGDGSINKAEMMKAMARMAGGKGAERMGKDGKDGSGIRPKRPEQNN